jgi:hypothetical protein
MVMDILKEQYKIPEASSGNRIPAQPMDTVKTTAIDSTVNQKLQITIRMPTAATDDKYTIDSSWVELLAY